MTKEYSPFTPGIPVPLELFIGRADEVRKILNAVEKAQDLRQVERIFVLGERGIGKSSICRLAITLAERDFDTLGLHVFLGGVSSMEEMARRIFERLLKESLDKRWFDSVKQFLGDHVRQVGLFGVSVEFDADQKQLERAVADFVPALRNLTERLKDYKRGILLVLDDLNGLASKPEFANWLKSMVDEIATSRDGLPLTIVLVGLPERRTQLISSQPSLDRVFDLVPIEVFDESEVKEFYQTAFSKVSQTIDEQALNVLTKYSGGYPVLMHEIGDAVFRMNEDASVDFDDALEGVFFAAQIIGNKYLEPKVVEAIRSDKYRSILSKLASQELAYPYVRHEVLGILNDSEVNVFDNFVSRMVKLDAMKKKADGRVGFYSFTREIYKVYFGLQSEAFGKNKDK